MNSMIIAAAGRGKRFGAPQNKLLEKVHGKPLIWYTLRNVMQSLFLDEIVLVIAEGEEAAFRDILEDLPQRIPVRFAAGGAERIDSVASGLAALSEDSRIVLIHDGARPSVDGKAVDRLLSEISEASPAALYVMPCTDTIKETDGNGHVASTPDRTKLVRAQTPQGALTDVFRAAMEKVRREKIAVTDDASILELSGVPVRCIEGKESYFKITYPEDGRRWEEMTEESLPPVRIGEGYDIHRFDESRPLILGGVRIRETGGLLGHSDADALLHAVMDALLGAAGLPDIGHYFPDTDPRYEGASSIRLLEEVGRIIREKGWEVGNIDSTILAEAPKMAPHIPEMRENAGKALHISPEQINIKATTNEKMGTIGRKEGIAALASALLYRRRS